MRLRLKGINFATKKLASGERKTYWYAWRNGPLLPGKPSSPEFIAAYNAAVARKVTSPTGVLLSIIQGYQASEDFKLLAQSTRRGYAAHIKRIEREFADLPLAAMTDRRTRGIFLNWRDRIAARSGRRQADYAWSVLALIISWALNRGLVTSNPCERGGRVYRGSRSDKIWTPDDEAQFLRLAPSHLHLPLLLALWTGQRQGDLLRLPWSAYDGKHIRLHQLKRTNPTRRRLGTYGALNLEKARDKARRWSELIAKGVDPASEEERLKLQEQRRRANTFAAVAEDYLRLVVIGPDPDNPRQRRGRQVERDIRRVFIPLWGSRPVTEITRHDVLAVIEAVRDGGTDKMLRGHGIKIPRRNGDAAKDRPAPVQARILLAYAKTLFSWAVERGAYGLEASPCDHLRSAKIIGEKKSGDRILSDDELLACWRAISRLDYPYAPLYRLLLLTGLRLNEVADAVWSEFDLANKRWTIPATRMKGKNGKAQPHVVPLTGAVLEVLATIPRFKQGEHLFSTTFGEKPAWVSAKIKKRLDGLMLEELHKLAEERGDSAEKIKVKPWTNHDLRRTLRSGLSALRVTVDVAEAVLAHVKPGIRGVYDRYDLFDEKRQALDLWASRLRSLVEPAQDNVVPLPGRAAP